MMRIARIRHNRFAVTFPCPSQIGKASLRCRRYCDEHSDRDNPSGFLHSSLPQTKGGDRIAPAPLSAHSCLGPCCKEHGCVYARPERKGKEMTSALLGQLMPQNVQHDGAGQKGKQSRNGGWWYVNEHSYDPA